MKDTKDLVSIYDVAALWTLMVGYMTKTHPCCSCCYDSFKPGLYMDEQKQFEKEVLDMFREMGFREAIAEAEVEHRKWKNGPFLLLGANHELIRALVKAARGVLRPEGSP